jgi:hypothetical protein
MNGIEVSFKNVSSRMLATAVDSKRTVARIFKEGRKIETAMSTSLSASGKSRPEKMVAVVDKFDEDVIRRLIYNLHAAEKQRPALSTLPPLIRDNTSYEGGRTFFRVVLDKIGFWY